MTKISCVLLICKNCITCMRKLLLSGVFKHLNENSLFRLLLKIKNCEEVTMNRQITNTKGIHHNIYFLAAFL